MQNPLQAQPWSLPITVPQVAYAAIAGICSEPYNGDPQYLRTELRLQLEKSSQRVHDGAVMFDGMSLENQLYYDPSSPSLVGVIPLIADGGDSQRSLYLYRYRDADSSPYDYAAIIKTHPEYTDDNFDGTLESLFYLGPDAERVREFIARKVAEVTASLASQIQRAEAQKSELLALL